MLLHRRNALMTVGLPDAEDFAWKPSGTKTCVLSNHSALAPTPYFAPSV
jgi:hypothetical protein